MEPLFPKFRPLIKYEKEKAEIFIFETFAEVMLMNNSDPQQEIKIKKIIFVENAERQNWLYLVNFCEKLWVKDFVKICIN